MINLKLLSLCLFGYLQDMTIQIDPHVTGFLKLPDLLDMMSRIILERNYDAQIEDAFRWDRLRSETEMRMCDTGTQPINLNSKFCLDFYWQPKIKCWATFSLISRCFDKNGIGTISRQDLHAVFENLGEKLVDDEIEGLLDEADLEGEGVITYSDFCAFKNLV